MSKKTTSKKGNTTAAAKKNEAEPKKAIESVEQKKIITAKEQKKIAAKPEAKKIATEKELEKIAAMPEPEKISSKPEPKKITEKKAVVNKAVKEKGMTKTADAAKPTAKTSKAVKTTKVKATKAEEKTIAKTKTPAKKAAVKKPTAKPTAKKTIAKKQDNPYTEYDIDTCIAKMQAMGVAYVYNDYTRILLDDADLKNIENNIIEGNALSEKDFSFEKDGFDMNLIAVTLSKIADTMDVKASDFKAIKKDITTCLKTNLKEDAEANASEYLKEFKLCEKILMIGQRKNISNAQELSRLIGVDIDSFVKHFFAFAYGILPTWQYDDVKFYEDFAYAILSQYADLYDKYQLNILVDCADLYIKHGDFQHGDENYGYILRDNQIKDYIYYRFASVYETIDINKAKALAYESLECVDERFVYYKNIMEIINK